MNVRRLCRVMPLVAVAGWWALEAARSGADPPRVCGRSAGVAEPLEGNAVGGRVGPLCFPPMTAPQELRRAIDARVDALLARHAALQEGGWDEDEDFAWWDDWPSLWDEDCPLQGSRGASSAKARTTQGVASSVVMGDGLAVALSYAAGQYHIQVAYPTAEGPRESSLYGDRAELEDWLAGLPKRVRAEVRRQLEEMGLSEPAPCAFLEDSPEDVAGRSQ